MSKISIIIPIYNVEQYIEQCVKSVINQTLKEIEIILVNDGSTDRSICEIEKIKDSRIILINQTNKGLSAARNSGLNIATSKYILFLDSDDFLVNNTCLEEIYNFAVNNNLDMIECTYQRFINKTLEDKNHDLDIFEENIISRDVYIEKLVNTNFVPVWKKIIKKEIIDNNKLFFVEGILHEDEDFTSRLILLVEKIGIYNKEFYAYRIREQSIMHTKTLKNAQHIIKIYIDLIKLYNKSAYDKSKNLLINRAVNIILETLFIYKDLEIDEEIKKVLSDNSRGIRIKILLKSMLISKNLFFTLTILFNKFESMRWNLIGGKS